MSDDLEILAPIPRVLTIHGRAVSILPLTLRQTPAYQKAIGPVAYLLVSHEVTMAVMTDAAAVIDMVHAATGLEKDWLESLDHEAFGAIAGAVLEVNHDFFDQRVVPAETERKLRLGLTPSPSSSATEAPPTAH